VANQTQSPKVLLFFCNLNYFLKRAKRRGKKYANEGGNPGKTNAQIPSTKNKYPLPIFPTMEFWARMKGKRLPSK
jgi:hypothetical protein